MNTVIEFAFGMLWATALVLALTFSGRLAWILLT